VAIRLARNLTGPDALIAGEYFVDIFKTDIGQPFTAYVACSCGTVSPLSDKHVVQKGGAVVPAFKCPQCALNDWLHLEGFGEPTP
jgi:hypothetical protein